MTSNEYDDVGGAVDDAIVFSAKHVGLWDESLSKAVRTGKTTKLYLDLPSLKKALTSLLKAEYDKGAIAELERVKENMKDAEPPRHYRAELALNYIGHRLKELKNGK